MRPTVSIGLNLAGRAWGFLIKAFAFLITITKRPQDRAKAPKESRRRPWDRGLAAGFARAQWDDGRPQRSEGAGNAGCLSRTRSPACEMKEAHEQSHWFSQTTRRFPRTGFNGL
jgi:hypothetical protein